MIPASSHPRSGPHLDRTTVYIRPGGLEDTAHRLAERPPAGELILDLGGVPAVRSPDLTSLATLSRAVRTAGGTLRLVNVGPRVSGALTATRLDTILSVQRADGGVA
jgi:anti-anti-sigma factor